jgi:hypothetical protein
MPKPQSLNHLGPKPKYEAETPRQKVELPRGSIVSAVEIKQLGNLGGISVWPTKDELIRFWPSSPWKEARESLSRPDEDKRVFTVGGFSDWLKLNSKRPDMTPSKQDEAVWRQKHHGLPMPKIVWIEVNLIRLHYQSVVNQELIDAHKRIADLGLPLPKYKGDVAELRALYFESGETIVVHQRHSRYVEAVQKERRREPQLGIKTSYGPTQ